MAKDKFFATCDLQMVVRFLKIFVPLQRWKNKQVLICLIGKCVVNS